MMLYITTLYLRLFLYHDNAIFTIELVSMIKHGTTIKMMFYNKHLLWLVKNPWEM